MEILIPEPADFWRELQTFRGVVDQYVKSQTDLAEQTRKLHIDFCKDHKGKLESIDHQKKKALNDLDLMVEEKEKERMEITRLNYETDKLEGMLKLNSELLSKLSSKEGDLLKALSSKRAKVEKEERIQAFKISEQRKNLLAYTKAMAMTFCSSNDGKTTFSFTHINPSQYEQSFEFTIERSIPSSSESIRLLSCNPPLPDHQTQAIINAFNNSKKSESEKISLLIRHFRREFYSMITSAK